MIKIIKYTLISLLAFIVLLNAGVYVLLNIPSIQRKLTVLATDELKNRLHTEVRIKEVDFGFLNKLVLKEVYIEDLKKKPLLEAKKMSVGINLFELLDNRLIINTIQLYSFHVYLSKDNPKAQPNYQFILDALKSDTKKKKKPLAEIQIKSIVIRRGNINYDVYSEAYKFGRFNPAHIRIRNLLATVSLHILTKDSIDAQVKRLGFEENSGFVVKKLSMHLIKNYKKAELTNFKLEMPSSELEMKNITLDYSKVDAEHKFSDAARFNLEIPNGKLCPHDIAAFVPALRYYYDMLHLEVGVKGTINSLALKKLNISSGNRIRLKAQVRLEDVTDIQNAYFFGKIGEFSIDPAGVTELVKNLSARRTDISDVASRAGLIRFNGEVSGFLSDLVAFGTLKSGLGVVRTDLKIGQDLETKRMTFRGKVITSGFNIGKLLNNKSLGVIGLNIQLDGFQDPSRLPQGKVNGEVSKFDFNQYQYKNIRLNGLFAGNRYEGNLELNDPNGYFSLNGKVDNDPKNPAYKITTRVRNLDFYALHLSNNQRSTKLSFELNADLKGKLPDNAFGEINIDSLRYLKNREELALSRISIVSSKEGNQKRLRISSPIINGELKGSYQVASLPKSILYIASQYLPSFTHRVMPVSAKNDFDFTFRISDTEKICSMFEIPVSFSDETLIKGVFSDFTRRFYAEATVPTLTVKKKQYQNAQVVLSNDDQKALLTAKVMTQNKKQDFINLALNLTVQNDAADCKFNWSNSSIHTYSGEIAMHSRFMERLGRGLPGMDISLNPSSIILNDTTWNIAQSKIRIDSGRVSVRDFSLSKQNKFLKINGSVSKNVKDTLHLSLKDINLEYVFNTLNVKNVNFGGRATGDFVLTNLLKVPVLLTDNFEVQDFSFNQTRFGKLNLFSQWDPDRSGILMRGSIAGYLGNNSGVYGYIFPTKDSISMNFKAQHLNTEFLKPYLGSILKDMSGFASGNAQLYGRFSKLAVTGDLKMEDFRFGVDYLNTFYTINDSLHLRPDMIYFNNINVLDKDKNVAIGTGKIRHDHLQNWRYSIQLSTRNYLVYNSISRLNPLFYGPVYGSGNVSIVGDEKVTNINVNMQTNPGTNFTISMNNEMTATEYNFITFRDRKKELLERQQQLDEAELRKKTSQITKPQGSSAIVNVNLMVDIAPTANLNLVMDPVMGDMIESHGSGNMKLAYSSNKDVRLFGTYAIERGTYGFNWQNVFKKKFTIKEGSSVAFNGSPYAADLDINAIYTTTADLADLDESFANEKDLSRTSTQVQCLLNASGDMNKPDLKFDLNFPNNSDEVNRRVKSIVNTDDMMARQIVFLLTLNRFYTPDNSNSGSGRTNQISSLASATLSSQFNNILSQVTDKVNIGTNVKLDNTDNYNNMEVQVALSSQLLNNRLLINGNLGYRDNITNKTTFIGDFDLEYKLTKSGDWRIKGYNHSNDRYYYLKSSLTTQGLGLIYKKDFNNLYDLFRKRIKPKK